MQPEPSVAGLNQTQASLPYSQVSQSYPTAARTIISRTGPDTSQPAIQSSKLELSYCSQDHQQQDWTRHTQRTIKKSSKLELAYIGPSEAGLDQTQSSKLSYCSPPTCSLNYQIYVQDLPGCSPGRIPSGWKRPQGTFFSELPKVFLKLYGSPCLYSPLIEKN